MSRSALQTVLAIASLAGLGGLGRGSGSATDSWCPRCQQRGKHVRIVKSVTGARYCHGCGYFEKKDSR